MMDIASSCLAGEKCRYNGEAAEDKRIKQMYLDGMIKLVCPEVLGGLSTPRSPSEIVGGDGKDVIAGKAKVMAKDGSNVTDEFIDGARKTVDIAKQCGAKCAYLKSNSPSCGCGRIYDGSFSGKMCVGDGVTAVLLKENGIQVFEV